MKIASLGEFGLIQRLASQLSKPRRGIGIGDDAAVIPLAKNRSLLLTTDLLLEGVHFRSAWGRWDWIGARALRVNISDIAAMGGRPTHAVVSLGLPRNLQVKAVEGLYRGMEQTAREVGLKIVGGDTNASDRLIINVALLGEVRGKPVLRSGAKVGDFLYVTGQVGEAFLGLQQLRAGRLRRSLPNRWVRRYWFPPIRVAVAEALRVSGVHAMIDVSDGLLADLGHLLESSHVGAELWLDHVPHPKVPREGLFSLLTGGDDYELLFTHPRRLPRSLKGVPLTCIGRILSRGVGLKVIDKSGRIMHLPRRGGFAHF